MLIFREIHSILTTHDNSAGPIVMGMRACAVVAELVAIMARELQSCRDDQTEKALVACIERHPEGWTGCISGAAMLKGTTVPSDHGRPGMNRRRRSKSKSRPILSDEEFSERWREVMPEPEVPKMKPEGFDPEGFGWAMDTLFPRAGESEAAHTKRMARAVDERLALERKRREQPN